jgi:predicted Zn-dependent protease
MREAWGTGHGARERHRFRDTAAAVGGRRACGAASAPARRSESRATPQARRPPKARAWCPCLAPRATLLLLFALLLSACATPRVDPVSPTAPPADSASDEAGLIMQMDRYEADLINSAALVRDPALNRYLSELTCRMAGEYCAQIRVYLVRQPYFNAQMAPNGMLIVWTGLLLRVEDEAQLAFVIGHEIGHYVERHSLARWQKLKSTSNLAAALQLLGGGLVGAAASMGAYSSLYAFGRDQERAADDYGLARLRELGYDDRRAGALWAAVWEEEKVRDRELLSSIFATHPASEERRDRLTLAAQRSDDEAIRAADAFFAAVATQRSTWLEDEIGRRHYRQTEVLMQRLSALPRDAAEHAYYSAEMYRRRAHPGDSERAIDAYRRAIAQVDAPTAAWRGLGLSLRQLGRVEEARAALREYLERAPQAEDRAVIESWLR